MQLVIIAGGKGTRLGLKDIPKPMVEIEGKPLLEYQIELAKKYGINEIFIMSGYLADVIKDYFQDGSKWGIKIHHITESEPLGSAGCIKLLEGKITERFMIFYGDIVMDFDIDSFMHFDKNYKSIGTILVHPNDHPLESDLIEVDENNKVTNVLPKPHDRNRYYQNLVNAAVYIFSPDIFKYIKENKIQDFGKDILPMLLSNKEILVAYSTPEYIKDLGTKEWFYKVCNDFRMGKISRLNKKNKRKAIFLDRDGVINKDMGNVPLAKNFELLDGVIEAIKKINQSEFLAIVVTNQPMIAKGFVTFDEVYNTHRKLETILGENGAYLNRIYFCPHHPDKGFDGEITELKIDCECRKPKSGMLLQAQREFNIDFENSWMIGDKKTDVIAGKNVGCKTILICDTIKDVVDANYACKDLKFAINLIMEKMEN